MKTFLTLILALALFSPQAHARIPSDLTGRFEERAADGTLVCSAQVECFRGWVGQLLCSIYIVDENQSQNQGGYFQMDTTPGRVTRHDRDSFVFNSRSGLPMIPPISPIGYTGFVHRNPEGGVDVRVTITESYSGEGGKSFICYRAKKVGDSLSGSNPK